MVQITSLVITAAAFLSPVLAYTVHIDTYGAGDCNGAINSSRQGASDNPKCFNFNSASYGAHYELLSSGATCVFKTWEQKDCHGKATVRTIKDNAGTCFPIADQVGGQAYYLKTGGRSVSVVCSPN